MRTRILFSKTKNMKYTSHLDLHRTWERTFRRAGLPLVYSKGFHPQPKINLASALPLGVTSEYEIVDVWFEQVLDIEQIREQTIQALPPGIEIQSVEPVDDNLPSLQSTLASAIYRVYLPDNIEDLQNRVNSILSADEIIRIRRGKKYDLRPLIEEISVIEERQNNKNNLIMHLAARDGATGRADEVVEALSLDSTSVRIHRIKLLFNDN